MQVTIEIEQKTFSLLQRARAKGISLDSVLREGLERFDDSNDLPGALAAVDWIASLKKWADQKRDLPDIPAEAFRRENLYEDRF